MDETVATARATARVFAQELKRLAALVERSLRRGDDIVAFSSLSAIVSLTDSLSQTVLKNVVANGRPDREREASGRSEHHDPGYL